MKLQQLIKNLQFKGIKNYKNLDIEGLSCDSQRITPASIYFCLRGNRVDGHKFASQALENGAVCLVVERFLDVDATQILVENSRRAMSQISANFYEFDRSKIRFIGVTGTNGKTTTSFIVKQLLENMGHKVGLIGTEGAYIGNFRLPSSLTTPDPINLHQIIRDMDENGAEFVVMEVSAHAIALNKVDSIMYDVVGITNISQDHLDYFVTMDNYAKAKASLFSPAHAQKAVVNIDTAYTKNIAKATSIPLKSISMQSDADLTVQEQSFDCQHTKAVVTIDGQEYMLSSNLIGEYNLANSLMAIGLCVSLGFSASEVIKAYNSTEFEILGRMNTVKTPSNYTVIVDFAHTPDGLKQVLSTLKEIKRNRLICVFGCGGNRDTGKRSKMGEVASKLADFVVVTSDNPRYENPEQIIADINRGVNKNKSTSIANREDAINYALSIATAGDIVAILGKGNEQTQEINGVKHPYSDFDVVKKFFNLTTKTNS